MRVERAKRAAEPQRLCDVRLNKCSPVTPQFVENHRACRSCQHAHTVKAPQRSRWLIQGLRAKRGRKVEVSHLKWGCIAGLRSVP